MPVPANKSLAKLCAEPKCPNRPFGVQPHLPPDGTEALRASNSELEIRSLISMADGRPTRPLNRCQLLSMSINQFVLWS